MLAISFSMDDAIIAAQTAVLAAEAGMGTLYWGYHGKLRNHRELLRLPDYVFPMTMLTLGYYPDEYKPIFRNPSPVVYCPR